MTDSVTETVRSDDVHALVFGASHANAVLRASRSFAPRDRAFSVRVVAAGAASMPGGALVELKNGRAMLNPLLLDAVTRNVRRQGREVWMVSILAGNYHNRLCMLQGPEPFDFILPGREDLGHEPNVRLLPYDLVKSAMASMFESLEATFTALRALPVAGVVHVEGPAPVHSSEVVAEKLPAQTIAVARRLLGAEAQVIVSAASVRLKAWLLQKLLMQEMCARTGVVYVDVPKEAMNPDGFRNSNTMADSLHANAEYGGMVLRKIEERIMSERKVQSHD